MSKQKIYLVCYSDEFNSGKKICFAKNKAKLKRKYSNYRYCSIKKINNVYSTKKINFLVSLN